MEVVELRPDWPYTKRPGDWSVTYWTRSGQTTDVDLKSLTVQFFLLFLDADADNFSNRTVVKHRRRRST